MMVEVGNKVRKDIQRP